MGEHGTAGLLPKVDQEVLVERQATVDGIHVDLEQLRPALDHLRIELRRINGRLSRAPSARRKGTWMHHNGGGWCRLEALKTTGPLLT